MEIEKYLVNKGFNPTLKGFDYIVSAVQLIREDRSYKFNTTKKLYPKLCEIYGDSQANVERAIRSSITNAGLDYSNSEFIAIAEIESR